MFVVKFVIDFQGVETTVLMTGGAMAPVDMVKPFGRIEPSLFSDFQQAFEYATDFLPRVGWPIKGMSIEPAMVDVEADGTVIDRVPADSQSYADQLR